ncbi:AraC family transcriptional regulator [Pedobacter heparinus]|uniref:AraC family transcriptional regulator n=1 Tax=Pedobacter heparinus TaxID=984 RepID=UPI00292D14B9|nr:AraC family transcriptional regulator [Pedobacter heparinus]
MNNYFKYLPVSDDDVNWGLYVLNAGYNRIEKSANYPPAGHPSDHYFDWDKGRILDEYQIIYISQGSGSFESKHCKLTTVQEGSIILLFPGEWHRFKPLKESGWDEYWVGFKGNIIGNIVQQHFISPNQCVLQLGLNDQLIHLFETILEKTKTEQPGYQALASGMILHLLGTVYAKTKQEEMEQEDISEVLINKARILLREYVHKNIAVEQVAEELQVSYSWFRKAFKTFTGIAPHQYVLQLKIEKAKTLLADTTKPIKAIASELGFESSFYFSRIFKNKTGQAPDAYRKMIRIANQTKTYEGHKSAPCAH